MIDVKHAGFCIRADVNPADPDHVCEALAIRIPQIGTVHVTADETGTSIYVEDAARGLIAEYGRYDIDDAAAVAEAMLCAARIARGDAMSATAAQHASAGAF